MATSKTSKTAKDTKTLKEKMHQIDAEFVELFKNIDTPEKWHQCFYRLPTQFVTGEVYRGRNFAKLAMMATVNEWSTPLFAPFGATKNNSGLKIKKGAHAVKCEFFKYAERFISEAVYKTLNENQKKYIKIKADPKDSDHKYYFVYPMVSSFLTFNADMFEDNEKKEELISKIVKADKTATNEMVLHILEKSGASIVRCATKAPCYIPDENKIKLPHDKMITDKKAFNGVCLHELAHWTARNIKKLERDIESIFGSSAYAFEELIAEFSSAFICARLNIDSTPLVSVDYLRSWHSVLTDKPEYLGKAVAQAQKIADWACDLAKDYKPTAKNEEIEELNEVIELGDLDDFELTPLEA